ncbi:MAG TPA: long-chain fatty acid--CoA ligase [Bacteroidota bacterium]|nr:long-chain fatty acid--CoA ligase [Bacteroidota bacterium]
MSSAVQFTTIPEMFDRLTSRFAAERKPALMYKADGSYKGIPYKELRRQVELFAFGLASLGVKRGDRVSIIAENRPEWVIADQAIAALGAVSVPVYPTMTAKQIEYIFNDATVSVAIVSNQFQLNKVAKISPAVPTLEKTVVMGEKPVVQAGPGIVAFSYVMIIGEEFQHESPDYLRASMKTVKPEDLLTIIYTSGTTGNPKGVMLTHSNLCSNIQSAAEAIPFGTSDVLLSFLPLSHSFERMAGYYTGMACGATVAFAESVETVRDNMLEVRPTIVTTVPRLFERIQSRIIKQVDAGSPLRRKLFYWAIGVGREYAAAVKERNVGLPLRLRHALADRLVFSRVKSRTGGRMRFFCSGGAALGKEFGEFFEAVGLSIIEGYGLTESSPVISVNRLDRYRFGSVGHPIQGVEVRVAHDGEILARGPNIMKGYWNNPSATREVIDQEGWLHTGDIGMIDAEGFIHITDRKKHLFVSSGGKNIAPQPIENLFLSNKYIEQFMLIGDRRMFLTALIVPDFDALKEYADARGIAYATNTDLAAHPTINELIQNNIHQIQKDLASYERVRKFTLLDRQFTVEEGELTPTQKVRRRVIEERYARLIEGMYKGIN